MRQGGNLAEVLMWQELKNRKFCGLKFSRQKTIGNYIADFACESGKIIIEVDGISHIGREEYDIERDAYLEGAGFKVIRVDAEDVKYNFDSTLKQLKKIIIPL